MAFFGQYPYGTDGGQDLDPDQSGTVIAQGQGRGCNFSLVTDDLVDTLPILAWTVLQRIYGTVPISGLVTTAGVSGVTIIVTKNGAAIDSAATTLNFGPSPDNSFTLLDSPAGTVNISGNYPTSGGINGVLNQAARADHQHNVQAPLVARSTRDEVASGQISITSTTGQDVMTCGFTMPNDGKSYLLVARASGACYSTNNIWVGVAINGTDAYYSGNIQSGPELREAEAWAAVTGSGQAVTATLRAKCSNSAATNLIGSGKIILFGFPYAFTH